MNPGALNKSAMTIPDNWFTTGKYGTREYSDIFKERVAEMRKSNSRLGAFLLDIYTFTEHFKDVTLL